MGYAISAGHELTAQVAEDVLLDGGNAFDAAVAAFLTSWITEPCMSGAGGGGFAMTYTRDQQASLVDFFCQTPLHKQSTERAEYYPVYIDFGDEMEEFHIGHGSAAVPGSVAGIFHLHERFGSIPMHRLVQPAIKHASEGVPLNSFQHLDLVLLKPIFAKAQRGRELYFDDGHLVDIGDVIKMPYMADVLDYLGKEGSDGFYRGEIASRIVEQSAVSGGHLTAQDLINYEVIERDPLRIPFRDQQILLNPFPSLGGSLMACFLGFIQDIMLNAHFLSDAHFHALTHGLIHCDRLQKDPARIAADLEAAYGLNVSGKSGPLKPGGTSHLNIVDKHDNAVALSMSIGEGSAFYIEDTDIQMNNMLGEAALLPNGRQSWQPDVRLSSMMSPTIVTRSTGAFLCALGSGGASRIPYMIGQTISHLLDYNKELIEAIAAPRIHAEHGQINVEPGFELLHDEFEKFVVKQWSKQSLFFGGVHTVMDDDGIFNAIGDSRRDGVAIVRN